MIHLTIDGIPAEVEKGTTILQAARQIGVEIPTLCYLEDVLPDGSCRLCVVEVTNNGRTKFDTACTLRCSEGDEVQTMSEKVVAYRKDTLDLLLSDHRVHCFSCEANGDCKLQDYCFEYGVTETSYPGEMKDMPIDDTNKFFTYDPSLCILCHRCVNTCKEIVGRGAIDTMDRGFNSVIGAHYKHKWNEGICESCGNCVLLFIAFTCVFLFAVFTSVNFFLFICKNKNLVESLFNGSDAAWILAFDHVDNLIRKFQFFFCNDLLVLDYVYSNVMIDKAENVKIEILNRAFNLDDIFLTHFVAARVLDDGNGAVKFIKLQIMIDSHGLACFDMV